MSSDKVIMSSNLKLPTAMGDFVCFGHCGHVNAINCYAPFFGLRHSARLVVSGREKRKHKNHAKTAEVVTTVGIATVPSLLAEKPFEYSIP